MVIILGSSKALCKKRIYIWGNSFLQWLLYLAFQCFPDNISILSEESYVCQSISDNTGFWKPVIIASSEKLRKIFILWDLFPQKSEFPVLKLKKNNLPHSMEYKNQKLVLGLYDKGNR